MEVKVWQHFYWIPFPWEQSAGARVVAQQVKLLLNQSASSRSGFPLPIQLPVNALRKAAEDRSSVWAPATHVED